MSIAVFISMFVVCLGCLAFLAFLWAADTDNAVWRSIVISGWTTRSITITSLVLRWATAAQAATCTSMLAAILLQKGGVPLPASAAVSIIRFNNTGPWSLLGMMKAEWYHGSISVGLLTTLLSLTTLSLQFTSTVLLSQVGLASLPVSIPVPQTFYGTDPDGRTFESQFDTTASFIDTTPMRFPAFAEWISNSNTSNTTAHHGEFPPSSMPGIRDTGTVVRAFLPINDDGERSRLTEYHGFATAMDTRVVCMRPKLTSIEYSTDDGKRISGRVDTKQKPLGLLQKAYERGSSKFSRSFDCIFTPAQTGYDSMLYGWPLTLCTPTFSGSTQGIYSVMEPKGQEKLGDSYLLINATMEEAITDFDGSDVWEHIVLIAEDQSATVILQVTLCMTAFEAQEIEINATRSAPIISEPALLWNTSTATYDTRAVLRQLGAGASSVQTAERGIFDLATRSWQWPKRPEFLARTGADFSTTSALDAFSDTLYIYDGARNGAQYSILSQAASSTANPALALQAFFTTLCAICYYDRIIMFDTAAPSSQVSLVQVTRPLGWTAFIVVVILVVVHLLLVLLVGFTFCQAGNLSRIQNAWVVISQLLGPATEDWIRDADVVDDKTVESWLKTRGLNKTLVRVETVQGRVQLVKKDKVV
ncbi:hypothetical protein NM208_g2324 [Fusarium decemcellulare]|uniref:Uncharacterized protein n=1 Tax=Fusarium decemcellulare TaxID=57161 RepID=A0ACC1ST22_9HYPO|nr:hypothetical protein NM208_g2324 [Fusarium decemcellulare]